MIVDVLPNGHRTRTKLEKSRKAPVQLHRANRGHKIWRLRSTVNHGRVRP